MTSSPVDPEKKELWDEARWWGMVSGSGILLVLAGTAGLVLSLLSNVLYASGQPTDAAGYLQLFSQHQFLAYTDWSLWILADLWLVPASIAMYLALKRTNKIVAAAGTLLSLAYIVYDVDVTELNSLNLVRLSHSYAAASAVGLRSTYLAAFGGGVAALPLETFLSFTIGAVGWLLWSMLMSKSFFGRTSAVSGVIVNVMGILGGVGAMVQGTSFYRLGLFTILGAPATALWFIYIGVKLFRHGNRLRSGTIG
jgi:hypothetical protein